MYTSMVQIWNTVILTHYAHSVCDDWFVCLSCLYVILCKKILVFFFSSPLHGHLLLTDTNTCDILVHS